MRWIPAVLVVTIATWLSVELLSVAPDCADVAPWPFVLIGAFASAVAIAATWHVTHERRGLVALPRAVLRSQFALRVQERRARA